MRTFYVQQQNEAFANYDEPDINRCVRGDMNGLHSNGGFVQIEIHSTALNRLLVENKLVVEELRCLNKKAKIIIKHALLKSTF